MAMPRNNAASGQAAANATRTRVAVSEMRAAVFSRRVRSVANSAVASGCGLAMALRTVSISHMWTAPALQVLWTEFFDRIACDHMSGLVCGRSCPLAKMVSAARVPNSRAACIRCHWLMRSVFRRRSTDHTICSLSCKFRQQLSTVAVDLLPVSG
jgi:hypothetical protein